MKNQDHPDPTDLDRFNTAEKIMDAIGRLDDDLIEAAGKTVSDPSSKVISLDENKKKAGTPRYSKAARIAAMAACLLVFLTAVIVIPNIFRTGMGSEGINEIASPSAGMEGSSSYTEALSVADGGLAEADGVAEDAEKTQAGQGSQACAMAGDEVSYLMGELDDPDTVLLYNATSNRLLTQEDIEDGLVTVPEDFDLSQAENDLGEEAGQAMLQTGDESMLSSPASVNVYRSAILSGTEDGNQVLIAQIGSNYIYFILGDTDS